MTMLIPIAVTNALTAVPLAILAWFIGRTVRRPALTHALWIIVLMKLVTPPLVHFEIPVSVSSRIPAASPVITRPTVAPVTVADISPLNPIEEQTRLGGETSDVSVIRSGAGMIEVRSSDIRKPASRSLDSAASVASRSSLVSLMNDFLLSPLFLLGLKFSQVGAEWGAVLFQLWILGSVISFGVQIGMVIRFGRQIVSRGIRDEALQLQADRLAQSMSLRHCPEVRLVSATISPMLWSCGARTQLLFPRELMSRLNAESRETLVIHELAHYGRGDHWVRCLEFLATGLFWWHPVVWWARRQIEEVEEECCDNWVVSHIQQNPRRYAEALLDTIDFLCGVPSRVPPMASGLGNASFLRRRLTNIMRGASQNRLSHRLRAGIAILMAMLLPFQPLLFGSASAISTALPQVLEISTPRQMISNDTMSQSPIRSRGDLPPESSDATDAINVPGSTPERVNPMAASPKPRVLRSEQVWSNAVSPNGRFVIRATTGRRVLLTDLQSDRETDLSEYAISAVSFTPEGHQFVAVTNDGQVMQWDAVKNQLIQVVYTHADALRTVSVSPEGDQVAVGGRDGSIHVISLETGTVLFQRPAQEMPVNCIRFSPDGSRIAVAVGEWNSNEHGHVQLISVPTGATEIIKCDTAPGALTFVSNHELIIGEWNGHATLWNLIQHKAVGAANADKAVVAAVSFSPDNPQLREIAFVSLKNSEGLNQKFLSQ